MIGRKALRLLVPSGIGDFSWTWSKLVTTNDSYNIEYIGGTPDRMAAFLKLLPSDKIVQFSSNNNYYTKWDGKELVCVSRDASRYPELPKLKKYSDLNQNSLTFVESNTFLEAGNRLERWFGDELPDTEFHYSMSGIRKETNRKNQFIVNFSSYGTKKAWGYYEVNDATDLVEYIQEVTRWIPVFVGGTYDDFTSDICTNMVRRGKPVINCVGNTPNLESVVELLQQSKMYFGACSGLMVMANVLYTPVCTYYPPFQNPPGRYLAGTWHDPAVPYMSLFWEGKNKDIRSIKNFVANIK